MSVTFRGRNTGKNLTNMGNARSTSFSLFTQNICSEFGIPPVLSPVQSDFIYVEEEEFCLLVERIVNHAGFLYYSWAQIGTGIYESIKGKKYQWLWPVGNTPAVPFKPITYSGFEPPDETDECIGRSY